MAHGTKGVKVSLGDGLRCDYEARGHHLHADEPEALGGTDKGPTPMELMLASLGACTAMTLRMYAKNKGWPLAGVEVELEHEMMRKGEAEDWPEGDERKQICRIVRDIEVRGDLDEEQVERLRYIAGRCPVHRTITEMPMVVDELRRGE